MTNSNEQSDTFLAISAWLTGYEPVELQGTGMVQTYYSTLREKIKALDLDAFFAESDFILKMAQTNVDAAKARTASHLMQNSSFNSLGKQIILMWYIGQWFADPSGDPNNSAQIDAQSYVEALMWPTADTHPPGAKQPGFGSWAEKPICVDTFNVTL
jgi:hypothetical protein